MSDETAPKARLVALIGDVDQHELACRIAEAVMGIRRPKGRSPQQAMEGFDPQDRRGFYLAADRAAHYLVEQINAAVQPS